MHNSNNFDKNTIMDKICNQIIQNIVSNEEIGSLLECPIDIANITKIKDLQTLENEKRLYIVNNTKLVKYLYLYTRAKIVTYGERGMFEISYKYYLKDGMKVEISRNKQPFATIKLQIYSSYLLDSILSSFLYLFYSGYSKFHIITALENMKFQDYEKSDTITKIKYYNTKDLKEVLLHIYTYDKHPTIILKHTKNFGAACSKLCSLFAHKCCLVGTIENLYDLAKGYITDSYDIALSIESALKNTLSESTKGVYILTDS